MAPVSDYDTAAAEAYERLVEPLTGSYANGLLDAVGKPLSGLSVLDCACGSGAVSICAVQRGASVTACDISPAMVARCAERCNSVATAVADLKALPEEWTGKFDVAVSSFGVIFCGDLVVGLREMTRCLKPGGVVLFTAWGGPDETPGFQIIPKAAVDCLATDLADKVNPKRKRAHASAENLTEALLDAMGEETESSLIRILGPEMRMLNVASPAAYWTRFAETSPALRE